VEKVFAEYEPTPPIALPQGGGHVVYGREQEFAEAWQRYYKNLRNETPTA
jgi:hypothetical protein